MKKKNKTQNLYKLDNSLCPSPNLQDIIQVHDAIKKEVQTKGHPFHWGNTQLFLQCDLAENSSSDRASVPPISHLSKEDSWLIVLGWGSKNTVYMEKLLNWKKTEDASATTWLAEQILHAPFFWMIVTTFWGSSSFLLNESSIALRRLMIPPPSWSLSHMKLQLFHGIHLAQLTPSFLLLSKEAAYRNSEGQNSQSHTPASLRS